MLYKKCLIACVLSFNFLIAFAKTSADLDKRVPSTTELNQATVHTYFSPEGGGMQAAANLINQAKFRVFIAAYSFTSPVIAQAIRNAHRNGVDVKVVLDWSNRKAKYSIANFLTNAGVDVHINDKYAIMHHKFIIADDKLALGSMNFSRGGELRNAENFNIFSGAPDLTEAYVKEFNRLYDESAKVKKSH